MKWQSRVFFQSGSVCLSVCTINDKLLNRNWCNVVGMCVVTMSPGVFRFWRHFTLTFDLDSYFSICSIFAGGVRKGLCKIVVLFAQICGSMQGLFCFSTTRRLTPSTPAVPNCCCSKGSAPYWSNPPFLIFDIWALWRSVLSATAPKCQKLKMVG